MGGLWRAKDPRAPAFADDGTRDLASELARGTQQFTVQTACKSLNPFQMTGSFSSQTARSGDEALLARADHDV